MSLINLRHREMECKIKSEMLRFTNHQVINSINLQFQATIEAIDHQLVHQVFRLEKETLNSINHQLSNH